MWRFIVAFSLLLISSHAPATDIKKSLDSTLAGSNGMLRSYKLLFPDRYTVFVEKLAKTYDGNRQTATYAGMAEMRRFSRENAKNIAAAPSALLVKYLIQQRDLLSYLKIENSLLCAQLVTGKYVYTSAPRPPQLIQRLSALSDTFLRAARQGIDQPEPRIYWKLSEADLDAYATAIALFGITTKQASMMDSNATLLAASPAEQCEVGVLMYKGASTLPPEVAANVAAMLVYQQSVPNHQ